MTGGGLPDGIPIVDPQDLAEALEKVSPSDLETHLDRRRPHDGQPQTAHGQRGARPLPGVTERDVHDAFVIGSFLASGLPREEYPGSLYELPWDDMDPIAVIQNALLVLERRAGLTAPKLQRRADSAPDTSSPKACIFCEDEWTDLCPPRLHALGDQAPRVEADGTGIRVTAEAPHLGGPITQELLAGHYVLVSAAPCRVIHQAHLDGGVAVLVLQGVSDDMGTGVASYDEGQAGG